MAPKPLQDDAGLRVLAGPQTDEQGSLYFDVEVERTRFRVVILPSRAIGVASEIPIQLANIAMRFAGRFTAKNRLLVHKMVSASQNVAKTCGGEVLPPAAVNGPPEITKSGDLLLRGTVAGVPVSIEIDHELQLSRIRLDGKSMCDEQTFFAAYDAALDYMEANLAAIAKAGFDTTEFESQLRALK